MIALPPVVLYAETHYRPRFTCSLLKRRRPEILADAPFRVEPFSDIPVVCLVKDADLHPILLESITFTVSYPDGHVEATIAVLGEVVNGSLWSRLFWLTAPDAGVYIIDVDFQLACRGRRLKVHNDNYVGTSHKGYVVRKADDCLPCVPRWHYGETHLHSSYTLDEMEFGAPIGMAARVARSVGLSWMCVTDHSYDFRDTAGSRESPPPSWQNLLREVEEANRDVSGFTVLAGEEISCGSEGRNVHLTAIGLGRFIPGDGDSLNRGLGASPNLSVEEVLRLVAEQGGISLACHPLERPPALQRLLLRRGAWATRDLTREGLSGWLIWNGEISEGLLRAEKLWVEELLRGKRICIAGGNDAHGNFNRFRQIRIPLLKIAESQSQILGAVRTCIHSDSPISTRTVTDALRAGRSIVTDGPFVIFEVVTPPGDESRADTSGRASPGTTVSERVTQIGGTVWTGGGVLRLSGLTTAEHGRFSSVVVYRGDIGARNETVEQRIFRPQSIFREQVPFAAVGPGYFRIEAITESGRRCLTNPLWVNPPSVEP